jgi:tetratricopeptide (TPR) repeat protein
MTHARDLTAATVLRACEKISSVAFRPNSGVRCVASPRRIDGYASSSRLAITPNSPRTARSEILSQALSLALALALLAGASGAEAQDKAGAKKHFEAGLELMQSEEFSAAAVEFEESERIYETKSAMLNLASCYKALRRYDEALAALSRLEQRFKAALDQEMQQAVLELRSSILSSTGTLVVEVESAGASVLIDGAEVGTSPLQGPVRLAPGEHRLEVIGEGMTPHRENVRLLSGQQQRRSVSLVPAPQTPAPTQGPPVPELPSPLPAPTTKPDAARSKPLLIASASSTAVTVALGIVAGVLWSAAGGKRDDYEAANAAYTALEPGSMTKEAESAAYAKLENQQEDAKQKNAAAVGLTVGAGALVAVSAVLWLAFGRSGSNERVPVTVSAAPGGLGLAF